MRASIEYGDLREHWSVSDDRAVTPRRAISDPDRPDAVAAVIDALEHPHDFPPLRQALTPDDRIALVIDGRLPQLADLVAAVLGYLTAAGVSLSAIRVVDAGDRPVVELNLPPQVHRETHDVRDRSRLTYVAANRAEKPIYFNRTVADADQAIVLTAVRARSAGPESLYPALADTDSPDTMSAGEMAWLIGTPFFIQVIEGAGDAIHAVVAGPAESAAAAKRLFRRRWAGRVDRPAELVIAGVSGDPARIAVEDLTIALTRAARLAEIGGRIALLTSAAPAIADPGILRRWTKTARRSRVFLLSGWDDEFVEDLRATPFRQARQVQRLIDQSESCLILPDAHRSAVRLETNR